MSMTGFVGDRHRSKFSCRNDVDVVTTSLIEVVVLIETVIDETRR